MGAGQVKMLIDFLQEARKPIPDAFCVQNRLSVAILGKSPATKLETEKRCYRSDSPDIVTPTMTKCQLILWVVVGYNVLGRNPEACIFSYSPQRSGTLSKELLLQCRFSYHIQHFGAKLG